MPKLLMLQGLPASGKSTQARGLAAAGYVVVEKDQIRAELSALEPPDFQWSQGWEDTHVIPERNVRILQALREGKDVVSSDTNFGRRHKNTLKQIAVTARAEFEIKFLDVPVDECVRRDALRTGSARVGEKVIRDMATRYQLIPATVPNTAEAVEHVGHEYLTNVRQLPAAIICDLDGTLALFEGQRSPYDASRCEEDKLNIPVAGIVRLYADQPDRTVLYVSGREDKHRDATERWLQHHKLPSGPLHMRKTGDFRKDWLVKYEIFNTHIRDSYFVEFILDDRGQVVAMWRELGLTCLAVADGDF